MAGTMPLFSGLPMEDRPMTKEERRWVSSVAVVSGALFAAALAVLLLWGPELM